MKHTKSIIAIVLFTLLSFAQANATDTAEGITAVPVELKVAGTVKNQPLLQLNFSGTKEENQFSILIADENGVVLYSASAKGEKFSKQFILNTDDLGDAVLKFEISSKKTGKTVVFQVSRQTLISEQMNVVKL
ncbi:MAG: hypothetical protein ABI666_01485 [Ferruginibacter sp.]